MAGSGPTAEGSWAGPGPGAETAGEPGAAAAWKTTRPSKTQWDRPSTQITAKHREKCKICNAQTYYTSQIMFNI